ncbi:unnamed protein product [Gadus morhua 'NCC']
MAGRSSCVTSLWSGTERVRIGERLKATLAGVLELELLRCKHLDLVDGALEVSTGAAGTVTVHPGPEGNTGNLVGASAMDLDQCSAATSRRQQTCSPAEVISPPCQGPLLEKGCIQGDGPVHCKTGGFGSSRWSNLSWDASSELLSPPTLDSNSMIQMDSDSRPSSGFYSVSGSSLSDSCYSVSSEAAPGLPGPPPKPPRHGGEQPAPSVPEEQPAVPGDRPPVPGDPPPVPGEPSVPRWAEGAGCGPQPASEQSVPGEADVAVRGFVSGDFETAGLSFLSDLCSSLSDPQTSTLVSLLDPLSSSSSPHLRAQLDPHYCTDLVSRRTKEVYCYPSPLHAVALQSPLFTPQGHESSASTSPEGPPPEDPPASDPDPVSPTGPGPPSPPSLTQLEQYISRLAHQYRSRSSASTLDLAQGSAATSALRTPSKGHGSTQSLSAFESRAAPSPKPLGGSATPCKSLVGNSAKVSLSSAGKRASRNSINLGNLPSATGEDVNINLNLNLNLNLPPGVGAGLGLLEKTKNGSAGALRTDLSKEAAASTSATSLTSSSSTATPGLRARSRISTCPSTLSHRSSLEVASGAGATPPFGSQNFCRSLDWSSSAPPGAGLGVHTGSAPGSQRSSLTQDLGSSSLLAEDSAMVEEIVRLSGLSRAVVVGLMEQGVELDVECFQVEPGTRPRSQGHAPGYPYRLAPQDHPHPWAKMRCTSVDSELTPPRPMQLSLSVTHSPQSHSGLTPPLPHSPRSQASLTPPLSHANSPLHPYPPAQAPALHYQPSHCNYQQGPGPSDLPSSTASSPAARPLPRGHSPPRPLQPSPLGSTPLSVFRRDAPSQCSLPRGSASAPAPAVRPRGGSLRQNAEAAGGGGAGGGWRRSEGEGLYRGRHASRELVRASPVSSYAHRDNYGSTWGEDERGEGEPRPREASAPKRTSGRLWRGWDGRLWGRESDDDREEVDRAEYGYGWSRSGSWRRECRRGQPMTGSCKEKRPTVDSSPSSSSAAAKGKGGWEKRSSSLRLSRTLFRSESQGLLVPRARRQEPLRATPWVSSLDVARARLQLEPEDGVRPLDGDGDKRLSSTASLFNLSRSQSLEGSCQSLSPPLSSPSFSPSPPPRTLQRSRSLRDLGKRMFGSMRSLSLKKRSSKK